MDTNKDGVLDKSEVRDGMKQHMDPFYFENVNWEDFMNSMDADQNNVIDF